MDGIRDAALRAFAEARGVAPEALDLNESIDDDEDETVVRDLCDRLGIEPQAMFPAVQGPRRGELAVAGLRRLAPFSPRGAERLTEMRLRWETVTIGSFIRSLEERRPVGSGRWEEVEDRPIPPERAARRFAAWALGLGLPATLVAWTGCNPACGPCPTLAQAAGWNLGGAAALVAVAHVAMLAAALHAMGRPRVAEAPL